MECKFLKHGVSIGNNGVVRPCCTFKYSPKYSNKYHVNDIDLQEWRNSPDISNVVDALANDIWPSECTSCERTESLGLDSSIRLNGESAYQDYAEDDITLEFRPGNVCNFACQTCWPAASTRVENYYKKAGIKNYKKSEDSDWDLSAVKSAKHRLRDIVLLGGEPFYDPKCLEFLQWVVEEKLTTNLIIFTNGSVIDREFLKQFPNTVTLVFSLDAMDSAAEYIRFGTVWQTVKNNYEFAKSLPNVNTRVNVTLSPYNYFYYSELLEWLAHDWPEVVSFGIATFTDHLDRHLDENVIPYNFRDKIIKKLDKTLVKLYKADIENMQKINAINAVKTNRDRLKTVPFDHKKHLQFVNHVRSMDAVKKISINDYCNDLADMLVPTDIITTTS